MHFIHRNSRKSRAKPVNKSKVEVSEHEIEIESHMWKVEAQTHKSPVHWPRFSIRDAPEIKIDHPLILLTPGINQYSKQLIQPGLS